MSGYTKLFASILESTVWLEPPPTKVVWITLLAMADRDGVVEASVPGLAKRAGVERDQCERALAIFMSPDPDSRTKEHGGRRLEEHSGGWRLLNYEIYRERASKEEAKEKAAERQRRKRDRDKSRASQDVTDVTKSNDIADPPAPASAPSKERTTRTHAFGLIPGFQKFWSSYPNKKGKDAAWKVWKKRKPDAALTDRIVEAIERQKSWPAWTKDGGQFIPHPSTWLNQGRWDDEEADVLMRGAYPQPVRRAVIQGTSCQHDPRCETTTACIRKTIEDGRAERARGGA